MNQRLPRRAFLKISGITIAGMLAACASEQQPATSHASSTSLSPDEALVKLVEGNQRFAEGKPQRPNQDANRRQEVATGQHPFAIILSCSDSRVPPEIVFDQGIGDLFIVRTAGNIADDVALGSIEYAVEHLGATLIVVLGHESCGAVTAATQGGEAPGNIATVVEMILPAVESVKDQAGDLVNNSINANAQLVAKQIEETEPIIAEAVKAGKVKVLSARYDLDRGQVTFF